MEFSGTSTEGWTLMQGSLLRFVRLQEAPHACVPGVDLLSIYRIDLASIGTTSVLHRPTSPPMGPFILCKCPFSLESPQMHLLFRKVKYLYYEIRPTGLCEPSVGLV